MSQIRKKETITRAIEILFLFALAYNFASWGSYNSLPAQLLGIFACIYTFNNWITTRSTFDIYQPLMFATDILIIFLSINLPNTLKDNIQPWNYSPRFWIFMGSMEFANVWWNLQILKATPSQSGRSAHKIWLILTIVVTCGCFGLYFYLSFFSSFLVGQTLAAILTVSLLIMTAKWNLNRYRVAKSRGISYLD